MANMDNHTPGAYKPLGLISCTPIKFPGLSPLLSLKIGVKDSVEAINEAQSQK
jgi:hypothetical protein